MISKLMKSQTDKHVDTSVDTAECWRCSCSCHSTILTSKPWTGVGANTVRAHPGLDVGGRNCCFLLPIWKPDACGLGVPAVVCQVLPVVAAEGELAGDPMLL
jgi:hypothetical protein